MNGFNSLIFMSLASTCARIAGCPEDEAIDFNEIAICNIGPKQGGFNGLFLVPCCVDQSTEQLQIDLLNGVPVPTTCTDPTGTIPVGDPRMQTWAELVAEGHVGELFCGVSGSLAPGTPTTEKLQECQPETTTKTQWIYTFTNKLFDLSGQDMDIEIFNKYLKNWRGYNLYARTCADPQKVYPLTERQRISVTDPNLTIDISPDVAQINGFSITQELPLCVPTQLPFTV